MRTCSLIFFGRNTFQVAWCLLGMVKPMLNWAEPRQRAKANVTLIACKGSLLTLYGR